MDKKIIERLQAHAIDFKKIYSNFPYKSDIEAVFELECKEYLLPLVQDILPFISQRLFAYPHETIEDYLPFILQHYHETVRKELIHYQKDDMQIYKKQSKTIENSFMKHILKYQAENQDIKEKFLIEFFKYNLENIRAISDKAPKVALELVTKLRNPQLQQMLMEDPIIYQNICTYVREDLINQQWDTWVDKYFTYPRTKDLQDYFKKWIGRDKLHIKTCSRLFEREHYEQLKIWLKGQEKKSEKKAIEAQMEKEHYENLDKDN